MDLLDIGTQCSHPSCNELDFLPIICRCSNIYCRHHIAPDTHQCPIDLAVGNDIPFQKLQRCAIETCARPTLNIFDADSVATSVTATCSQCQGSFCAFHRHPGSHVCPPLHQQKKPSEKNDAARALLAKNFTTASTKTIPDARRAAKVPTDSTKLAQFRKVELMRLRHKATPGDAKDKSSSPPKEQRINIQIDINNTIRKVFWFRRTMSTGRVLDCLASHAGITRSDSFRLQLVKLTNLECILRNDRIIADEVEDGDTLSIRKIFS